MSTSRTSSHAHSALVEWLATREAYEPIPDKVQRIETHISQVFLAGTLVYKLKKPVKFDFLDFSTLAAREHACREEARLNSRLAPGIYLGVIPVTTDAQGQFTLGGKGQVIDWLVQMRRLPLERTMISLHRHGLLKPHHLEELAHVLVRFYAGQVPLAVDEAEYRSSYETRVHANREELLRDVPAPGHPQIKRVHAFQLQLLQLQPGLFAQRIEAKQIYDGHGDLRPEHICFSDPLAIFDCIEFNDAFRRIDAADELAFLATECDYIGASWVEPMLFSLYGKLSGDHPEPVLLDFYKTYRASVRAKVAALRANQLDGVKRREATEETTAHLQLADRYAAPHYRPLVIVIGGLSGTGKSTLAAVVADAVGAELLRSDVVRGEVFEDVAESPSAHVNRYEPQSRQRVYDEMFRRTEECRRQQLSVVVDATFSSAYAVSQFRQIADRLPVRLLFVECWCRPEVARQRIAARLIAGTDASEATPAVFDAQRQSWDPWPEDLHHCRVDTEQPLPAQREQVLTALAQR